MCSLDFTIPFLPKTIEAADLDHDGDNDLVIGHYWTSDSNGEVTFCDNDGNGIFSILYNVDIFSGSFILGVGNLDNDPLLDVVISNEEDYGGDQRLCLIYNLEFDDLNFINLGFNDSMVQWGTLGDFDNTGTIDFGFTSYASNGISYWGTMYNLGNQEFSIPNVFTSPDNSLMFEIESKDFDNNNFDDFVVLGSTSYIFYSQGLSFNIEVLGNGHTNSSMSADDMDNDGDYDVIVSKPAGMTALNLFKYENIDNEYFTEEVQFILHPWGYHYGVDLNNDQLIDIIAIGTGTYVIYWNLDDMNFTDGEEFPKPYYGESSVKAAFADFDGNYTIDMAIIRYNLEENNLSILFNDGSGAMYEDPYVGAVFNEIASENIIINNYPNPFSSSTIFRYKILDPNDLYIIQIYDIKGKFFQEIKLNTPNNFNDLSWNRVEYSNNHLASGIYLYKLKGTSISTSYNKMIYLK